MKLFKYSPHSASTETPRERQRNGQQERDIDKVWARQREIAFMTDPPAECGVDED